MKKQPKVTPWFPADVKPVRKGVYQTMTNWGRNAVNYQYWDGKNFRCTDSTPDGAYRDRVFSSSYKRAPWRGLTKAAA